MKLKRPPRLADRLLAWFCAPHLLEEIQGDLYERYKRDILRVGPQKANRRYWLNALGFLRPFALKRQKSDYTSPLSLSPVMIRNYVKTSLRNLAKYKASTLINLCGLTLGVTACLVIYLITHYELSYDTFHPDSNRIYRLVGKAQYNKTVAPHSVGFVPNAVPAAVRQEISGIGIVAAFQNIESEVLIPNGTEKPTKFENRRHGIDNAELVVVEPTYFDIFTYKWLAGNPKTALNEPFKLVLSERKARKYFGDLPIEQIMGKELIYRDSVHVHVAGIVKDWDQPTDFTFTDFISLATIRASQLKKEINLDQWDDLWSASQAFVKLPPGAAPNQFTAQFQRFGKAHYPKEIKFVPALQPLSDLHFNNDYGDNYSRKAHLPTLYGLMAVAGFILLIAAINFINLSTAQSTQRAKETGIRKVMGSSRASLIAQFLSETAFLTLTAVLISLLLVNPILSAFQSLTPKGLTFHLFSVQTGLFLLAVTVITSLLAGLYPSLALSSYVPALTLKGQAGPAGGQKGTLRRALIIFQFTTSLVFIIGTLIVGRQLSYMRNKDLGFTSDAIVSINPPWGEKGKVLAQKIRQLSGVERVAMEWFPPMGQAYMVTKLKYEGQKQPLEMDVSAKIGDENFIPLYQLRLLAGRNYVKSDSLREIVINATYAKALGFRRFNDALNQLIDFNGKKYPIVGVVADFHEQSFHEKMGPVFMGYMPHARNIGIKLSTKGKQISDLKATLASIEQQWKVIFPDNRFEYTFLDDSIARLYEKEQKTGQLVNTATGIAILISCMGLFGLAMFTAEQRTKEIGVRKVLGASVASIVTLLSKDFLKLVVIALIIASPIAWWAMTQWLKDFAYKVDIEWWVFALAGILAVGIALFTISFQSIKAALVNPVKSLRSE